ncbi:MAG: YqgE/AlgH family protein [Methylococcaceae bacterium]
MTDSNFLANQFLIAMPNLGDPNFSKTVTYLCQHNSEGGLGIVINRPTDLKLVEIFRQMDIKSTDTKLDNIPVFFGGPIQQERGFIVHTASKQWDSTIKVSDDISLTTSRDILEAIAIGEGPDKVLVALGYAGWGQNQLEKEMIDNVWLTTSALESILFDTPVGTRWSSAANQIGVDINLMTGQAGHG